MKFNLGLWRTKPGVSSFNAEQVRDVRVEDGGRRVRLYVVSYRQDVRSMDGPAQEWTVTSPGENMLRVQTVHFKGDRKKRPQFELTDEKRPLVIEDGDETLTLASGRLALEIKKTAPAHFVYRFDGVEITRIGEHFGSPMMSYVTTPEGPFMRCQLQLGVGEKVYGLGERFTPFVKNGQVVETWNEDGGTSSEIAYKSIPFYLTNRNYGVLVNESGPVSFEVASEHVTKVQFSVPGQRLDFILMAGEDRKAVLERYTALTGRANLPPAWSFGLWLTSSFTTSYDEATVTSFVEGMRERDIPLSVFHFDCFWMKENEWCGFEWDKALFPDVEGLLSRLHARGLRVCVWINPYLGQKSPLFDEAADKGYLLRRPDGDIWQWDLWQAGCAIVDFTNPEAKAWYQDKLRGLLNQGVDAFKTDFGERIPTDVAWFDGSDPEWMHNYYTYLYNKAVFEVMEEARGAKEMVLFARSATVGGQKFPVHWGGDCNSTYVSMAESLRGGLSLGLSGFGFWGHDISGFEGTASPDLYKRWLAFGLLSSHSRLHGSSSYRVPWLFGEEAVEVCRTFAKLKNRLMPYLFASAVETTKTGLPMMRAMMLEFDGPAVEDLDRQYMLGDALLVAPVMAEDGTVDFYLPEGRWTHLLTGESREGGRWLREQYDFFSLPLFVRENTILPWGGCDARPDYDYADGLRLDFYAFADGASATREVFAPDGTRLLSVFAHREADTLTVRLSGAIHPEIRLVGMKGVRAEIAFAEQENPHA